MNGIFLQIHMFRSRYRSLHPIGRMPWIILLLWGFLCVRDAGRRGSFPFNPTFQKFRLVGTDHFGLVLLEYWGPALKVVHFDRCSYLVRSDQNVPFHLTKLLSTVQLFCILLTRTITKCAGVWVRSVQLECTGIFVEWKVPLVSVPGSQQHIPTLKFVKTSPPPPTPMHLIPRHQAVPGKLKKNMVHPRFIYRPTGRCLTKTIYEWFKKFAHCLETLKWVKHSHSFLSFNIYWPCK